MHRVPRTATMNCKITPTKSTDSSSVDSIEISQSHVCMQKFNASRCAIIRINVHLQFRSFETLSTLNPHYLQTN